MRNLAVFALGLFIASFFFLDSFFIQMMLFATIIIASGTKQKLQIKKTLNSKLIAFLLITVLITTLALMKYTKPVKEGFNDKNGSKEGEVFTEEDFEKQKNIQETEIKQQQFKKIKTLPEKIEKQRPLKVKNALLLKKNTIETFNQIITDFSKIQVDPKDKNRTLFEKAMIYFRMIMIILTKENRMLYVGLLSLLFSVVLTFMEFSL